MTPVENWPNDKLLSEARAIVEDYPTVFASDRLVAAILRELARRFSVALHNERARYEAAARACGGVAKIDRDLTPAPGRTE